MHQTQVEVMGVVEAMGGGGDGGGGLAAAGVGVSSEITNRRVSSSPAGKLLRSLQGEVICAMPRSHIRHVAAGFCM